MPQWLCNQFRRAYIRKDRRQIRWLGECWYLYHGILTKKASPSRNEKSGKP
jgi:hypothetical protein